MDNKQLTQKPAQVRGFGKLVATLAERLGLDSDVLIPTIKTQCFPNGAASDGQLFMLMSFARQYDLNPLARECYAFISGGRMQVGVQADGWSKIADREEKYDGQEIEYHTDQNGNVTAITSRTHVKGRRFPTIYRAEMKEWKRNTDVWNQMPIHQLYLKARDEGIRFAFGIPAYDPDDLERIESARSVDVTPHQQIEGSAASKEPKPAGEPIPEDVKAIREAQQRQINSSQAENQPQPAIQTEQPSTESQPPTTDSGSPAQQPQVETRQAILSEGQTVYTGETADIVVTNDSGEGERETEGARAQEDGALRAELDKLIDRSPPARINLLLGQQGVTKKEELSAEQVKTVIRILSKGKK